MMNSRICYVFPSRSRPDKFFDVLHNIRASSASDNYFIWAKLDEDDSSMNNEDVKARLVGHPEVTVKWGQSKNKVDAINRSLEDLPECDIIVLQSDDIQWDVFGFDAEIRKAFATIFPDFDGAVHFPDDHGKKKTIIVSILGINLYKRLGYIYHPDFISVYADDFFTDQCRKMKKYAYVHKRLFTHKHPHWRLSEWDAQYRRTEAKENYAQDRATYLKLQANNYGL